MAFNSYRKQYESLSFFPIGSNIGSLAVSQVDTLVVVPNQQLYSIRGGLAFNEAFQLVDNILYEGVQGVTDLIVRPGIINLDFADVRTIMTDAGLALIGTGEAEGEDKAAKAAERALFHPLLEGTDITGAKKILINITSGPDLTLFDVRVTKNQQHYISSNHIYFLRSTPSHKW